MTLSIYIKKRLLSDAITLFVISAAIYLAMNMLSSETLENNTSTDMAIISVFVDKNLA